MCRFRHIRRCPHRSATFNLSDDGFMTISIKRSSIYRVRCSLPFLERLFSDERILDDAAKSEWIDEVQARLCAAVDTLAQGWVCYEVERTADGVGIATVSANVLTMHQMAMLCAGEWPGWFVILKAVQNSLA